MLKIRSSLPNSNVVMTPITTNYALYVFWRAALLTFTISAPFNKYQQSFILTWGNESFSSCSYKELEKPLFNKVKRDYIKGP